MYIKYFKHFVRVSDIPFFFYKILEPGAYYN